MSTFMRHQKQTEKWKNILKILDDKFDGNPTYIKEAREDYSLMKGQLKKLRNTSNILASIAVLKDGPEENKTTHVNLNKETMSIFYPVDSPSILSYSLDILSTRRVFPVNISSVINRNISKDLSQPQTIDERQNIQEISKFLRNFCSSYNLTVNRIHYDKNSKVAQFETTQRDKIYGSTRQFITLALDKNKSFELWKIKDNLENLSTSYTSPLSYFSLFGFSDIFARCTCRNYTTKYTKKRGLQNYLCSHLMYSMSMFPYYLLTILNS